MPQHRIGPAFVRRVAETIDEADGDGFHPRHRQLTADRAQFVFIKGQNDAAVGRNPLRHFPAQAAGHQGFWFVPLQIEHIGRAHAADLQDITKTFGRDQPRTGAALLQQCIGPNRGAMQDLGQITGPQTGPLQDINDPG